MKKLYESKIESLKRKNIASEVLLRRRKEENLELRAYIEGQDELISLLSAFICEGIHKSGRVEINKADISEGLRAGYNINYTEDKIILERKSEGEGIDIEL